MQLVSNFNVGINAVGLVSYGCTTIFIGEILDTLKYYTQTSRMLESMKIAQRSTHPHNKILYHIERMSFLFVLSTKLMPPLKVNLVSSFSLITSSFMAPVQIRIDPVSEKSLVALRLRQFKRGCLGR